MCSAVQQCGSETEWMSNSVVGQCAPSCVGDNGQQGLTRDVGSMRIPLTTAYSKRNTTSPTGRVRSGDTVQAQVSNLHHELPLIERLD